MKDRIEEIIERIKKIRKEKSIEQCKRYDILESFQNKNHEERKKLLEIIYNGTEELNLIEYNLDQLSYVPKEWENLYVVEFSMKYKFYDLIDSVDVLRSLLRSYY